ncbi:hypothetical protein [Photobacterium rosenbergii]|nr:hypothetical protein [Photobacterium rosenbergii]MBY5948391.1 hypothetical protein [Photobacterium rosenbergii]
MGDSINDVPIFTGLTDVARSGRVDQTPPVLGSQHAPNLITDLINVP